MRFAYLALVVCSCSKAEKAPPPVTPPPEVRDAAVALADAALAIDAPGAAQIVDVELIQLTAASVRVSSKVANPNIKPTHLVDKNLSTAWNSVTGELRGAWIEITPIEGAEIHTIKLTPGFTAKGPKGEDWFTMNPRIRKMRVVADGLAQPDIYLDVDKRELQAFPIIATESVRLEVTDIVDGTKKKWREISVSELEAWGTTPVGWSSPKPLPSIDVEVGAPPGPEPFAPCKEIEATIDEARERAEQAIANCNGFGCDDLGGLPLCALETPTIKGPPIAAPWDDHTVWCESKNEIYGDSMCSVRFARGTDEAIASHESARGRPEMDIALEMREVIVASSGPEIVVAITEDDNRHVTVCRADSFKCSSALVVPEGADLAKQTWVFK